MKPNTIAASNENLAREISKLITETDLKIQRKLAWESDAMQKKKKRMTLNDWEAECKAERGVSSREGTCLYHVTRGNYTYKKTSLKKFSSKSPTDALATLRNELTWFFLVFLLIERSFVTVINIPYNKLILSSSQKYIDSKYISH